jgi:TDG/mug DNA glycosylase family protein
MPKQERTGLNRISGFPLVVGKFVRVLILGSMPGKASLARNEYYGLPHNVFWRIMGDLFSAGADLPYSERLRVLTSHGVALWDVLDSCYRPGSLDSAIDERTAKINDFAALFSDHRMITHVFFNGKKAADIFAKRILPIIENGQPAKTYVTLPSTSPALASMTYAEKLDQWVAVKAASA